MMPNNLTADACYYQDQGNTVFAQSIDLTTGPLKRHNIQSNWQNFPLKWQSLFAIGD